MRVVRSDDPGALLAEAANCDMLILGLRSKEAAMSPSAGWPCGSAEAPCATIRWAGVAPPLDELSLRVATPSGQAYGS